MSDGYGADSGPSRGDPCRPAIRPTEASKGAVCYVRSTSTPVVSLRKIPDFAAFPEVDIRAMVGVVKHRYCFQPMMQPGEMKQTFVEQGLVDVTETQLLIRMDYQSFDDFWAPIAAGEGPLGKYVATLNTAERARADAAVRDAYEAGRPDGPRSFANVAWACRGLVP